MDKDHFANLAIDAVLPLKVRTPPQFIYSYSSPAQGSTDLDYIQVQVIKKVGGQLTDSYFDEG